MTPAEKQAAYDRPCPTCGGDGNHPYYWSSVPQGNCPTCRGLGYVDGVLNADKQRAYRDRRRGGPPRQPKPCGTLAAVRRHQRRGEPLDAACREAYNAEQRRLYAQRRR